MRIVYEIWTDVDGVYNCDPRLVDDARLWKSAQATKRRWNFLTWSICVAS